MKIFTLKKSLIFFVIIASAIFLYAFLWQGTETSFVTEEIKRADLKQIVDVNATTESNAKISLRFQNSGQIESISTKKGDTVKKDQLLTSLENENLVIELEKAKANLNIANAELNLKYAGPAEEEKVISSTKIEEAEINLKNSKQIFEDTKLANIEKLKKAELDVENAKLAFTNAEKSLKNTEGSSENSIKIAEDILISEYEKTAVRISAAYNEIKVSINAADKIIGVDNTHANDAYDQYLGTKSLTLNGVIIDIYSYARRSLEDLEKEKLILDTMIADHSSKEYQSKIDLFLEKLQDSLSKTKDLLDMTYQLLEFSAIEENLLQTLKDSITTRQSSLNTEILNTESLVQSIDASKLNLEKAELGISSNSDNASTNFATAENNLKIAETALSSTKVQNKIDENNAQMKISLMEIALKQAKASYDNLVKNPRYVDTATYIARVDNAKAAYKQVEKQMKDSQIFAPMGGQIIDITKKVGENISLQEDMIVMMTEDMQLKANVSENDVNKISIGDTVDISFDSLPISETFKGTVSAINPAETIISGVIYYEAYITLMDENDMIKSGMTADLEIQTANRQNIIVAPIIAIEYDGTKAFAYVLVAEEKVKKELTLGLEGDEYVEILEGLKEGENIIIYEK